jgi:uncharacterized protein
MASRKDEAVSMAKEFIAFIRPKHDVRAAYIFGSFAKGTEKDYSDIDLAIILGTEDRSAAPPFDERFQIFHEAQKFNSLLEVVCFNQEEFDRDGGGLGQKIKKEGIRII